MLKPYPLSAGRIDDAALAEDKKTCRKIGPCGIGRHALYLNSFFVDRRYYVPLSMVTRVYKRVAMSKGGFSGKGIFATLSYLVVYSVCQCGGRAAHRGGEGPAGGGRTQSSADERTGGENRAGTR